MPRYIKEATFKPSNASTEFTVSRVLPNQAVEAGRDIQRVGRLAYEGNFEGRKLVGQGSIKAYVFNELKATKRNEQAEKIQTGHSKGVAYWTMRFAQKESEENPTVGFVKTSPSPLAPWRRLGNLGNCFINDICVEPSAQHKGIASAGLYTALQGYDLNKAVATHLFSVNDIRTQHDQNEERTINDWFRLLGLRHQKQVEAMQLGAAHLPQYQYGGVTVGDVMDGLTYAHPWLVDSEMT